MTVALIMSTVNAIAPAAISNRSIGSKQAAMIRLNRESGFSLVKLLTPYLAAFSFACSVVSPALGLVFRCDIKSSFVSRKSCSSSISYSPYKKIIYINKTRRIYNQPRAVHEGISYT